MNLLGARELGTARWGRRLVQASGFVFYLLTVQALLTAAVGAGVFFSSRSAADLALPAVSFVLASAYALVGYHLRRQRLWARNFAFAFAAFSLFAYPVGTGVGLLIAAGVAGANRAGMFPAMRRVEPEERYPLISFEPELVAEQAG
jgi:hypothetical protein